MTFIYIFSTLTVMTSFYYFVRFISNLLSKHGLPSMVVFGIMLTLFTLYSIYLQKILAITFSSF